MAVGAKLWTSYDGNATLQTIKTALPANTTAYGGLTGLQITGPVNKATVVGPSDIMACKAYLTMIDTVLLPFAPASVPADGDVGAVLGAGQCVLQANAALNATALVDGASNRQRSGKCQRAVLVMWRHLHTCCPPALPASTSDL